MLRVSFVVFKCVLCVLIVASAISTARAADWYPATPSPKVIDDWIVSVDASTTGSSSKSYFMEAGVTAAIPGSLSVSGARLRVEGLAGTYEYLSTTKTQIRGQQVEGAALGGYEWVGTRSKFAVYLGGMALNTALSKPDPHNSASRRRRQQCVRWRSADRLGLGGGGDRLARSQLPCRGAAHGAGHWAQACSVQHIDGVFAIAGRKRVRGGRSRRRACAESVLLRLSRFCAPAARRAGIRLEQSCHHGPADDRQCTLRPCQIAK